MSEFQFDRPQLGTPQTSQEVRTQFNSLGTTNYTTLDSLPANPREGMQRVNAVDASNVKVEYFVDGDWRLVLENIQLGNAAVVRITATFTSLATWTVDHNLSRRPLVGVTDASGFEIYPDIQHTNSDNRVVVSHTSPETGTIVLLG